MRSNSDSAITYTVSNNSSYSRIMRREVLGRLEVSGIQVLQRVSTQLKRERKEEGNRWNEEEPYLRAVGQKVETWVRTTR